MKYTPIRRKIVFWTVFAIIITAVIIVSYSVYTLRQEALESAKTQVHALAHEQASTIQIKLSSALDTARTLAQVLAKVRDQDFPLDIPRYEASHLLRSVLSENPYFLSIFTCWEPDAYDFLDAGYANEKGHDDTGRFSVFWQRYTNNEFVLMPLSACPMHSPNGQQGEWYTVPKETGKEFIQEPFVHPAMDEKKLITAASVPVMRKDEFLGVVGVDLDLGVLQKQVDDFQYYDNKAEMAIISNLGRIGAFSKHPEHAGKHMREIYEGFNKHLAYIKEGRDIMTVQDGKLYVFSPFTIGTISTPWAVNIIVPISKVTEPVMILMWRQVLMFSGILLIMILLSMYGARTITRPIYHLYNAVMRVKDGDLSTEIEVRTNDEIGLLSMAFDKMRANLKDTLYSLKVYQDDLEKQVTLRTAQLHKKTEQMEKNRERLKNALDHLSTLIEHVTKERKFASAYFEHPKLGRCWEKLHCDKKECPCFGKPPMRCWQIKGTHCRDEVQGDFLKKIESCKNCKFYQQSLSDPVYQIGEQFNNMMFMLERNNRRLVLAFKKLKQSQSTILQQEKMASVGQLAAGVAHEINNPVGFIMSNLGTLGKYVERLKEFIGLQTKASESVLSPESLEELDAERKKLKVDHVLEDIPELIKESVDGAERVKEIVQNLKSFSRIDETEVKSADINECLETTIKIVWNELKYKCEVVKEYGELPLTLCNAQQLNQVFVNLLVNAAQAIENQGIITIKTWAEDNTIFVSISDTGNGIPGKNLGKLFEPFFTTKEVGKGTGLGLSIAYDIITKKHKGEINVDSEVGKGTTFTIKLPVVEIAEE